jgi:deoxyribodipyrimidine photo-lyase
VLATVVAETGSGAICWNRLYDPASIHRDRLLKAELLARGVECHSFNGGLLNEPWEIRTASGDAYRAFTPYWRVAHALAEGAAPAPRPPRLRPASAISSEAIDDWRLRPQDPDWSMGFGDWRPGEAGAQARLDGFLAAAAPGGSRLSPHLHFGEISPRQVWAVARPSAGRGEAAEGEAEALLRELGRREFNHNLLFHFPEMARWGLTDRSRDFPWRKDPSGLEAWRRGMTGFPIIDAGMRELLATGWMHSQVRMITASFLVRDLMVDWRCGEAWFWERLVDADLANNVAEWQSAAGAAADASPFLRVFKTVLQGEKFDPDGDYVRRWTPELARLPNAYIHQPWRAGERILAAAGVRVSETYPAPIVDLAEARHRAMAAYETSI